LAGAPEGNDPQFNEKKELGGTNRVTAESQLLWGGTRQRSIEEGLAPRTSEREIAFSNRPVTLPSSPGAKKRHGNPQEEESDLNIRKEGKVHDALGKKCCFAGRSGG